MSEPQTLPPEPSPPSSPASSRSRPPSKPKGSWWAETKNDLKWASVLLIGAVIAGPLVLHFVGFGGDPWPAWAAPAEAEEDLPAITDAIFTTQLVPFEILSVLLLAALVAGVVIAFRDPEGA